MLTRLLAGAGAVSGVALLARPQRVVDRLCPELPREHVWAVRLLGARMLLQHGAVLVAPQRGLVRAGATVDVVHALSMAPLAASVRYGRAARISGSVAAASAALTTAAAPRS
jgi:hypothetical protein